ncbi:diguanylate cyclase [Desulfuromonas acetoxidans]|uniref:sensor domain-containing diguanylate cyclase n=1 Tax=Desulfuromonas acetoxidans TaxID=891 RepID=UPI00138A2E9E|nr:diguanylate cyclase [Desulfuromonas acetoxidans]
MIFVLLGHFTTSFLYESYLKRFKVDFFNLVSNYASNINGKLLSAHRTLISVAEVLPGQSLSDSAILQEWLDDRRGLLSTFDNGLFIFDAQGSLIVESPFKPKRRGRDYSFRQYYQETVQSGKPIISDPYASSQKDNHPSIMMTVPIFNEENDLIALFCGSLDLLDNNFLGDLPKQKLGRDGYFFLASMDREIIAHPDVTRIMKKDFPVGVNPLFDLAMKGIDSCDENVNSKGLQAVSAFKKLSIKDWVLGANYPLDEIQEPLIDSRRLIWLFMGGAFCIVLLFTLYALRAIFNPLFSFTHHLETLASKTGEDRFFTYRGRDELSIMTKTFNSMIKNLDETHHGLNHAQKMAHLGSWRWNLKNNELEWSDEVFRMMGDLPNSYRPTLEYFIDKIPPEDRDEVNEAIQVSMDQLRPYEVEHRIIDSQGQLKYVREQGEVCTDEDGNLVGMVGTVLDITTMVLLQQKLERLATTDELTGAVNRRQLFIYTDQFCQLAKRYKKALSVIFYDLDHFKAVNDTYGHAAGDEVLRQITTRIQSMLRDTDILARYGGEEFCILVPETDGDHAYLFAERIRQRISESSVNLSSGESLQVTVSMGVATYQEDEQGSSLIDRADQGVYEAKRRGRNCVVKM